jgi:peptidyl-prolyl cis-trans isomerase SurA
MRHLHLKAVVLALATALALPAAFGPQAGLVTQAEASNIKVTVNKIPITSLDISQRTAFLKLQRRKGNLAAMATDELIDEALKRAEIRRLGLNISDKAVADAFANFASQNKLKPAQLEQVLNQSGVTAKHFKEYIRIQMGWGQTVGSRLRATSKLSEQDAVRKMLEKGGAKPSATEYMLQQVIFVVPAAKRGQIMGQRKKEASAMRARFNGCENTRQFATGLKDVTVRDLGRFLAPELPPEWAELIKKTQAGGATGIRETEKGVEFIGICRAREVSDDKAAMLTMQAESTGDKAGEAMSEKYVKELRDRATIVRK